jgi:hypothetical protein
VEWYQGQEEEDEEEESRNKCRGIIKNRGSEFTVGGNGNRYRERRLCGNKKGMRKRHGNQRCMKQKEH